MTSTPRSNPTISHQENVRAATLDRDAAREEKFLTVAEIAQRVRVTKMTIYRLIEAGHFPGTIRVGKNIRVPERAVIDYLKASVISQ